MVRPLYAIQRRAQVLGAMLAALFIVCPQARANRIVFSHDPVNHSASRISDWSDDKQKACDFTLASGARVITKIYWWGSYGANPDPAVDSFVFKFFEEDSSLPGFPFYLSFDDGTRSPKDYTSANFSRQATSMVSDPSGPHDGGVVYAYSAVLDTPITLEGNKRYWLAVTNSTPTYAYPSQPNSKWGWLGSSAGQQWYRMGHCPACADDWAVSNSTSFAFCLEALPEVAGYKHTTDGTRISGIDLTVTASFPGFFYVRSDDGVCGLRVYRPGHTFLPGNKAHIVGSMDTNLDHERFVDASSATPATGSGNASPLSITVKTLGGGACGLQDGVKGGFGVNNIGQLVRVCGSIITVDQATPKAWFTLADGSGSTIKVTVLSGISVPNPGTYVSVTGASSCEKIGNDILPVIRMPQGETVKTLR